MTRIAHHRVSPEIRARRARFMADVRMAMTCRRLNVPQLARRIGVKPGTLAVGWLRDLSFPTPRVLSTLCAVLNLPCPEGVYPVQKAPVPVSTSVGNTEIQHNGNETPS